nr:MopE-related protein [Saprospiraceae bacterium]
DNRNTWTPLVTLSGNQGDKWKRETLSLAPYDGMTGIFRFVGTSGEGPIGDIAIDQIEFYKSTLANGLKRFYVDNDDDGYGIESEFIDICSSELPEGYALISGDCDDENPSINPGISEIQCNGIDENCNGNGDDSADVNPILYTSSIIDASCNGSFDGSISLNISGGTGPYTVTWPGQNQTGNIINDIKEGFYYAEIMDIGGCLKKTDFFNVKALNSLNIVISEIRNTTCQGLNDGIITIEHNINNPPYTYLWSNGDHTKNVMNLKAGEYSVTVTDANLCTASISKIIVNDTPSLLSGIESIKHPTCQGMQNGFISAIVQNGSGNYRFQWNTGDTTRLITNLSAGDYSLTVYDQNGCESFLTTKLVAPDSIKVVPVSIEDVRCFGESNGSIKTNSTGGTPPYTYLWTGIRTTDDIFNLAAGKYTLTVTDALGCRSIPLDVNVKQPELFEISIDSIHPSMCRLGKNGYVSLITQGGTKDYSYAWSHSEI